MKYLKLIVIFFMCLSSSESYSQTVFKFFQELPGSAVMNLPVEEREKIISISKDNKDWNNVVEDLNTKQTDFVFEEVDTKSNYLKLIGNFEGKWEMKVWTISSTYCLIGIYKETCGPVCQTEQLDFYVYLESMGYKKIQLTTAFPVQKIQKYISSKLLPPYELEADDNLDYLLFQFNKDSSINVSWNEFMAEKYRLELNFQLYWLPDNLKNETYFGIKEN